MLSLVTSFLEVVQPLSWAMSAPVYRLFLIVLTGWIFSGRRTLSAMLVTVGVAGKRHHAAFYRVFSSARWGMDQVGLIVFEILRPLLAEGSVALALDDTLAHKRGLKVFGAGMHRDPLFSTRKKPVLAWGHDWVILAVIVRLPCCPDRVFSLPILCRLFLNHDAAARARRAYRTRPELATELLHRLCETHPSLRFHVFADSAYGGESVLGHLPQNCDLTSRLPLDARLYDPPAARKPGVAGRPRKRGARLASPQEMLQQRARRETLGIYGRKERVRLVETVARWHGVPDRPLRIVAIDPLAGGRPAQAFYSTCAEEAGKQVLVGYSARWSIEEANQAAKSHLGFEEPQAWSRLAVLRTAPIAMLLYSLILVWFARDGHRCYRPPTRPWYPTKTQPSFADMLLTLRRESLLAIISQHVGLKDLPQNLVESLFRAAQIPA